MEKARSFGLIMGLCAIIISVYVAATGNAEAAWGAAISSGFGVLALAYNLLDYEQIKRMEAK